MPPKPSNTYSPVPEVAPTVQMPFDVLTVRGTGTDFGSQVGEALSKKGEAVSQYASGQAGYAEGEARYGFGESAYAGGQASKAKGEISYAQGLSDKAKGEAAYAAGQAGLAKGQVGYIQGVVEKAQGDAGLARGEAAKAAGEAKFAGDIDHIANQAWGQVFQQQGMANEHAANQAEMTLAIGGGKITDKYKTLTGLDAANAKDSMVSEYTALNSKIREGLNPAAARAYDSLASRRMSFAIADMNSYAADQTKKAYQEGHAASANLSLDSLSRFDVASNTEQTHDALGNIVFQVNANFTAPKYGKYQNITARTDSRTGKLVFDSNTQEGRLAQADYDNYLNNIVGKGYENAVETLWHDVDNGSVTKAEEFLKRNQSDIPAATYAQLSTKISPAIRNEEARQGANFLIGSLDHHYSAQYSNQGGTVISPLGPSPTTRISELFPGSTITSQGRTPEHNAEVGGVPDSMHLENNAIDFVLPKGISFSQVKDTLIAQGIKTTELINEGDHVHLGWGVKGGKTYQSQADFYRTNYADAVQASRDWAESIHPGDATFSDAAASRVEQRMSNVITQQGLQDRANQDLIQSTVQGDSKHPPITDIDQLENNPDPKVRKAWTDFSFQNPIAASNLQTRLITANTRGKADGYGTDFYDNLVNTLSGKVSDPSTLYGYIKPEYGKDSPLTNTGYSILAKESQDIKTPEGKAFADQELQFLQGMKNDFVSSMPGMKLPTLESVFRKSLMTIIPRIQSGREQGKSSSDLFDPKSPDYVAKDIQKPTKAQMVEAQHQAMMNLNTPVYQHLKDIQDPETGVKELHRRIKEEGLDRKAAAKYSIERGWRTAPAPQVPFPE